MGRTRRNAEGKFVYHTLHRGNARPTFLYKLADFAAKTLLMSYL